MLFYIDGDNAPGTRTAGVELLAETDTVKVFYASNSNKYYSNKNNRDNLKAGTSGRVSFSAIGPAADAVDFAIAIDCARECALAFNKVICLVSQDKHFNTIKKQIATLFEEVTIVCAGSVKEGFAMLHVLEVGNLHQLENNLYKLYGDAGCKAFEKLKGVFEVESASNPVISKIIKGMFSLWKKEK